MGAENGDWLKLANRLPGKYCSERRGISTNGLPVKPSLLRSHGYYAEKVICFNRDGAITLPVARSRKPALRSRKRQSKLTSDDYFGRGSVVNTPSRANKTNELAPLGATRTE